MRKMMKAIAAVLAVSALMVGTAFAASPKLVVKGTDGTTTKFVVNDDGTTGIGVTSTIYPLEINSGIAGNVPAGVGMMMMTGASDSNKERFEIRSMGTSWGSAAPTFQGKTSGYTTAAAATNADSYLFNLAGSGHSGVDWVIGNKALISMRAEGNWSTTSQGTYINFATTAPGTTTRMDRLYLSGSGIMGIGSFTSTAPPTVSGTGKLHIQGDAIRIGSPRTPASATDTCNQGELSWDTGFVYVCTATNTWKRAALSTWP